MTDLLDYDAYHSAIVRIATVREQSTTEPPQLLFASVELITSSRPVPDTMQVNAKGVPQMLHVGETKLDLAFRRVAMDAEDAVNWYRSLASNPTLPIPRSTADVGKHDGKPIQTFALMDEPTWPAFSKPLADPSLFGSADDLYPTPFVGSGAHPFRVHRQFADLTPLMARVMADQASKTWLQRRIHFDIGRHDELLGGAVLIIPDPDVRAISTFMARDESDHEYLVGEVRSRRGRSLQGLTLTLFEERFGAINLFNSFDVGEELMIVQATDQLDHTGHTLSHAERGLIDQQKALPYLRRISLNMSSVSRRMQVATRDDRRQGATIKIHEVDEVSLTSESVIDLEPNTTITKDAASRFYSNAERRIMQRLSRNQQLQWFDERETALKFIRERISRAKKKIMIVDPYADGEDLFNFGHFITRRDIALSLLTSRLAFMDSSAMSASFGRALQTFQQRGLPTPEIRVLSGGKNPPIHDRFLIIDGDVWLSGNSLNAIGARASVMLKLPDPASVRARLEKYFGNAQPLDNIVAPK